MDGGTTLIPDPRARDFWDPARLAGTAFEPLIGTHAPAWDTWMLFGADAMWRGTVPPTPAWWEDQLYGLPRSRFLNPRRFATKAAALEAAAR